MLKSFIVLLFLLLEKMKSFPNNFARRMLAPGRYAALNERIKLRRERNVDVRPVHTSDCIIETYCVSVGRWCLCCRDVHRALS